MVPAVYLFIEWIGSLSNRHNDGDKSCHKFAHLTIKNSTFARLARAFHIFVNLAAVLVPSTMSVKWPVLQLCGRRIHLTIGSLSNHDDDGNKNVTNLHIWQWKNNTFARFARAFFIFWHFADVLVLSTTWNDLFCSCVDDVSIWWQMFNFVFLSLKRWFQLNSRIVRTYFASVMTWIIEKWFQKREVTLSDDVLAAVDVVFA